MDPEKKVLILHASAGHGHEKAARAVEQACLDILPRAQVKCCDALTLTAGTFGKNYKGTYLFLIRYFPWLWGLAYYASDVPLLYFFIGPIRRLVNAFAAKRLAALILEEKPTVVIATHFLSVDVVSRLKQKRFCRARLVVVVTDFLAHSFWLAKEVDVYAVASEETKEDLLRRGVPPQKILVSGIPVEKKFTEAVSRAEARNKLMLGEDRFTALITSGGAGVGSLEPLVSKFLNTGKPVQLLVVCGTNQDLLRRMQPIAEKNKQLRIFAFVDNIQELMAASNLVIGKGGGLTVTESLCLGNPLVLFGSVPGQETRKARTLARIGAARVAHSLDGVVRLTTDLMDSPALLKECTSAALRLGRPKAAEQIVQAALEFHE